MPLPATQSSEEVNGAAFECPAMSYKQGTKRKKYAARACHQCKRRKVKCSGEEDCQQCFSRSMRCAYSPAPSVLADQDAQPNSAVQRGRDRSVNFAQSFIPEHSSVLSNSPPLPGLTDPRVDGLCDRVKVMEHTLARLLESTDATRDASLEDPLRVAADRANEVCDEDDANQFTARNIAYDDLTLSSQVAAMSALLSRPPSPKPRSGKPKPRIELLLDLPDTSSLQHLLDVYFRDFDCYFPFLDIADTQARIHSVLHRLGHSDHNRVVVVTMRDLSIVSLLCYMLAMAECVDAGDGACDGDMRPGWDKYIQGCRAIQRFSHSKTLDLDVVRAQCIAAAYLMHNEVLHAASRATSVAWELATSTRLHDKKTWPAGAAEDAQQRQKLWWTIYFLDRQISRRSGTPYHIRDTEFDVDDFTTPPHVAATSALSQTEAPKDISRSYIQALIHLGRLWGHVWDTFFAIGATKKGDWMEVEIMDARILNIRRQLPAVLTWTLDDFITYTSSGEQEPHIRRRLLIYTRLTLLRMLIRQNPVRQAAFDAETAHLCSQLSREVIHAHELFISQYPEARATGYFTTSSVVECIYHLAPVMHHSKDQKERAACASAFNQAHGILIRLSIFNNVAKKALRALNGVVRKWGTGQSTGSGDVRSQMDTLDCNTMYTPFHVHDRNPPSQLFTTDVAGVDFTQWMDVGMGPLFGNEFDFQLDQC